MFGIGTGELLVIMVIAMLAVGPERMVVFAGQLGRLIAKFRAETDSVTKEFREAFDFEIGDDGVRRMQRRTPTTRATGEIAATGDATAEGAAATDAAASADIATTEASAPEITATPAFTDSETVTAPVFEADDTEVTPEEEAGAVEPASPDSQSERIDFGTLTVPLPAGESPASGDNGYDEDAPIVISVGELIPDRPEEAEATDIGTAMLVVDEQEETQGEQADRHAADEG
jgi:sec-independent protein translocase protein TatB